MSKHLEINESMLKKQIKDLDPIELIVWAFEHGYKLGQHDMREGIHINTNELRKQLANDIVHYINNKTHKVT